MNRIKLLGFTALYLTLAACSGGGGGGVTSPVIPVAMNTAPVAQNATASVQQDTSGNTVTLMATDADGDALTYAIDTAPTSGTLTISGNTATYTPNAGYNGTDSFTFTANDGTVSSNVAMVDLTVIASARFSGKITSPGGADLSGVQVEAFDAAGAAFSTATSDASGNFELSGEAGTALTLLFTRAGFANQVAVITLPDLAGGALPLDITMISRPAAQSVNADTGGLVSDAQGASVTVLPGSFVDADGNAVSGNIDVTITPVNTGDITIFPSFPGEFSGIEEMTGAQTPIATLGTVEYTFTQGGAPLQLASGQTAQIDMPLWTTINPQTGNSVEAGDSIPLWSLNEGTGIWEQEGSGTVVFNLDSPTGLVLRATVSHFTWWNIDYPIPTAQVEVNLTGTANEGVGIVNARTDAPGFRMSRRNIRGGGSTVGIVPANFESCFSIDYIDTAGAQARTAEQCIPNPIDGAQYTLNFAINIADTLTLSSPVFQSAYSVIEPIRIDLGPQTFESSVTYAVTSGTLPSGLTLTPNRDVYAVISGTVPATGSYQFTITGTDAGGNTDDTVIAFDIVNPPPPVLAATDTTFAAPGTPVFWQGLPINTGFSPITSWAAVDSSGNTVSAGTRISSGGLFSIDSFAGGIEFYQIKAYSAAGPSNTLNLTVTDQGGPQQ